MSDYDYDNMQEQFHAMPEGSLFAGDIKSTTVYLKPQQSASHHLDEMAISLKDGSIIHWSHLSTHNFYIVS